ncbi:RHS repeat-associated core domain-containing protein, partial [Chryseobacterium sp. APV1]|nr:RHS repeat-associated core domain-containing protein [Chryseobacterium sp. APV1]
QNVDTYYVYNEYNQLAFVLSPKAVKQISDNNNLITDAILNELCYQYRYDGRDRLVEKRLPGKEWELMVYDKQDRVVLTQDAILRTANNSFGSKGWLFTKYDEFGRVAYTGFFSNTASRQVMQNALNSMTANAYNTERRSSTSFNLQGLDVYYDKQAFPTGSMTLLSVNYYDTYPPEAPA